MKIAFICDPLDGFKIYKDSTYAMMTEAARRGHAIHVFQHKDMAFEGGKVVANISRVTLTGDPVDWYRREVPQEQDLTAFDAILERTDPPFNMEYIYATYLLELAQQQGARIFNKPEAIRSFNEKLAIAQFPHYITPTLVSSDAARVRAFHDEHRDIILKPLDGMGGAGIFRVMDDALNLGSIIETLTDNGRQTIMVQRYIPEITQGDKRILLIGGQVVPYCLARIPQGTEIRGNLAVGGVGVAHEISARDREMGEALAPVLLKRGLLLVGLDAIGDYMTELNVTSPTCFQEIRQQTGFDVAAMFVNALEKHADAWNS
ncbi:glutathione synthetase (Glutathione synthase) (GSH synthetase) (GSH-S) (GSHase) [Herminiimonas arsenicoxydans]|uniref:Glutathione synthetase n=1 Tax=Herminiimonas arsenicoxydans TaxID=204773 RepID=A4G1J4_HERAR|nr:glutathione synthetase (Glutathione synthase) (GSH synthetase) (GSH-S) (GSHase) [Herminiimonas arsenicoxydans]